jgi:hypothetical protein
MIRRHDKVVLQCIMVLSSGMYGISTEFVATLPSAMSPESNESQTVTHANPTLWST